mmetsp:Transcript_80142/g.192233  ORF Transcript_80142/g.192233 Transcript_80142/m.192233 type:complete len:239 (-) Transcript_80142:34-750(-)
MCARTSSRGAREAEEKGLEDQLSTRTASSSSLRRSSSRDEEMSPGQSASAALFAAVLAATGKLPHEPKEVKVKEDVTTVAELRQALQDVQRRTAHVVMQTEAVAAECRALDEQMAGLAAARHRRELEVAAVWQDIQVALAHAQQASRHRVPVQEPSASEEIERLRKESKRQAAAIQLLRKWKTEAEARRGANAAGQRSVVTAELAEERRRRSQVVQREMDDVQRLHALLRRRAEPTTR